MPIRGPAASANPSLVPYAQRSAVSLISGDTRYDNVLAALTAIEDQILPVLAGKLSVLIKPNVVNPAYPLAITHPDCPSLTGLRRPRTRIPVACPRWA
jgi:hypothetical protein